MFGMKKEDGDALLDDVVRLGQMQRRPDNRHYGPSAADLQRDEPLREARSESVRLAAKNLKVSTALDVTQKKLAEITAERSKANYRLCDVGAMARASMLALDSMVERLAQATGRSVDEVRLEAHAIMRKSYDKEIGELLSTSVLIDDPRQDPEIKKRATRDWYFGPQ
jgi:hypothetical protein